MVVSQAKNNQYHHVLHHSLPQNHTHLNETFSDIQSFWQISAHEFHKELAFSNLFIIPSDCYIYFSPLPFYIYNSFLLFCRLLVLEIFSAFLNFLFIPSPPVLHYFSFQSQITSYHLRSYLPKASVLL